MSEFFLQTERLLSAIADPEYRYLLLEPLLFYGLLTGAVMLVFGLCLKAPRLQVAAVAVLGVASLSYFPYRDARLTAQPRMEQVYKSSAPARARGFAENTAAWVATSWQFRLLVVAAFATLLIGIQRNRIGFGLGIATMLLGFFAAKNAMWLNYQDALAYHPNLTRHDAPIDRKSGGVQPPREPAARTPAIPVAEPVSPAAQAPVPAPARPGTNPPSPDPVSTTPPSAEGRIGPPRIPFSKKTREVHPLPRF